MPQRTIVVPPEHLFPADEWRIIEARWMPSYASRAETALALSNGYLGVRGIPEEGRPAFSPAMYVNGFHETWPIIHAEDAYGLARVGQTIVNVLTRASSSRTSTTSHCSSPPSACRSTAARSTCATAFSAGSSCRRQPRASMFVSPAAAGLVRAPSCVRCLV